MKKFCLVVAVIGMSGLGLWAQRGRADPAVRAIPPDPPGGLPTLYGAPMVFIPPQTSVEIQDYTGRTVGHFSYGASGNLRMLERLTKEGRIPLASSLPPSGIYRLPRPPGAPPVGHTRSYRSYHTPGYMPPGRKERMEREAAQEQAAWGDQADADQYDNEPHLATPLPPGTPHWNYRSTQTWLSPAEQEAAR